MTAAASPAVQDAITRRMTHQGLWRPTAPEISGVLRAFLGIQAQEFPYALWSIAQRTGNPTSRADLLRAYDDGQFLRTHVLRPTWHFALPADIRWMLRLTAPKLRRIMASYTRAAGLDADTLTATQDTLAAAVDGGRHRTRKELAAELEQAGIPSGDGRLGFILMHAEYDEVLISGAMQGKQQTYAAFDERVPAGPDFDEDEALAELARRFVATRAPVTAKDLAGWASLTLGQARRRLAAIEKDCVITDLDGMTMWSPADAAGQPPVRPGSPTVDLVQGYDEVIMSYFESRRLLTDGRALLPVPDQSSYYHAILVDGTLAGHWRQQLGPSAAVLEIQLRRRFTRAEHRALAAAVDRYGVYLGLPTSMPTPTLLP